MDIGDKVQHFSTGSIGTISNISKHADEIENFIKGVSPVSISSTDKEIENPSMFMMENHLEDFLVKNGHFDVLSDARKLEDIFSNN